MNLGVDLICHTANSTGMEGLIQLQNLSSKFNKYCISANRFGRETRGKLMEFIGNSQIVGLNILINADSSSCYHLIELKDS
ncbi:MAG: hypothetical protein OEY49_00285 [Candidatus Heimdallarchaeota archaeon]|nr:hypothetical protein [Candidatus Heimdallarchaeota archaeon]